MSVLGQVIGSPGMRAALTVLSRMVTRGGRIPDILPVGRLISGAASRDPSNTAFTDRLRAGLLMGKIASVVNSLGTVGYYAPSLIDVTAGVLAAGATSITISVAGATELSRRCGASGTFTLTGPAVAGGTVVSETVTYSSLVASTGVITCTAIVNAYVAGAFVQPTDGSQDPITFIPNGWPIKVTDENSANADVEFAELPVACQVDGTQLLPVWPSDAGLQRWIINRLNSPGRGMLLFDQSY